MGDDARALEMYEIALSVVEARGVLVSVGLTSPKEYRVRIFDRAISAYARVA